MDNLLDTDQINELKQFPEQIQQELLQLFSSEFLEHLEDLEKQVNLGHDQEIKMRSHLMRSQALNLGANEIAEQLEYIEANFSENKTSLENSISSLKDLYPKTLVALKNALG